LKRVQVGTYYSHFSINVPIDATQPPGSGKSNDRVLTGRVDINRYFNLKVEGHFMAGYGLPQSYPAGFYYAVNPQGLKPNTTALIVKGGFNF